MTPTDPIPPPVTPREADVPWRCGCGELNNAARKDCGNCGANVAHPYDPIFQREMYPPQKESMTPPVTPEPLRLRHSAADARSLCVSGQTNGSDDHCWACRAANYLDAFADLLEARAAKSAPSTWLSNFELDTLWNTVKDWNEDGHTVHGSVWRRLIAQARAAARPSPWQPIETAPKDTSILIDWVISHKDPPVLP